MYFTNDELKKMPLSQLIRLSVWHGVAYDRLVEGDGYEWDMGTWLFLDPSTGTCSACVAGAVMLGMGGRSHFDQDDVPEWMDTIDDVRVGAIDHNPCMPSPLDWAIVEANILIQKHWSPCVGRAPWNIYIEAADILQNGEIREEEAKAEGR